MVSHVKSPYSKRERTLLWSRRGSWEGYIDGKQGVHGFALTEYDLVLDLPSKFFLLKFITFYFFIEV